MSCLLKGALGTILILLLAAIIVPNYVDYRAAVEVQEWLRAIEGTQKIIASNAERDNSLTNSGVNISKPVFDKIPPSYIKISNDGIIFLKGGEKGQLVVLVPVLSERKVSWRCIAGSEKPTSKVCKNAP